MQLDLGLNLGIYNEFRKALDLLSVESSAAYSLRKLRNAYTGSAIRVRRSLDNAEADIGFSGTDLDTTALTNFVGSQNLLQHSEAFNNAAWEGLSSSAETIAVNTELAPDGTMTADRCTVIGASSGRYQQITLSSAGQITFSTHIKVGSLGTWARVGIYDTANTGNQARCWVNMGTGELGTVSIVGTGWSNVTATSTNAGNGYYRVSVTATCTATAISVLVVNANANNDTVRITGQNRILWGAQLNQGALQPYSPTTSTARDGNGFVTTWYDQSGNARNATQATAANQPSIVTAGVVNTVNGKPVQRFNGSAWLSFSSLTLSNFAMIWVSKKQNAATGLESMIISKAGSSRPYAGDDLNGLGNPNVSGAGADIIVRTSLGNASPSGGEDALHVSYAQRTGTQATGGMNGQVNPSATVETASMTLDTIGRYSLSVYNYIGDLTELMMMESALTTTDRQTLERNQGSYYNITVS